MKSITKVPRALLNVALGRGRSRLPRLIVLVVVMAVTYTVYHQLSQQTWRKDEEIALKNIKERHVNDGFGIPNPNNQVDAKYKDGRDSANQVAAERHQDVGESPRGDNREKANDVKRQQDAEVALENLKEEGVKQERDQDGANDGRVGDAVDEAIREEMVKLDQMELKKNYIVLVEDEEAALSDKDDAGAIDNDNKGNNDGGVDKDAAGAIDKNNYVDKGNAGAIAEAEQAEVIDDVKDVVAKDSEGGDARKEEAEREAAELRRMTAEEVAAAIRSGEMCKTVCPPFTWSDWSPCSKACGQGRRYRKAVYDFVCSASEFCPINRIEESVCDTPCKFDPDKYGGPNGLDLYPINPLNPAIFPEERDYMCGPWLVEYEKIHTEILEGKRAPSYLVYSTGKGEYPSAGGLSGRLKGITTVFFMAVLLERAFLIEWLDPSGLENYLVPKGFNWADLTPIDHLKRGKPHDIGSWKAAKENGKSSQWYMDEDFSKYFKNPVEVIQGPRYDYTYAILRNPSLMPKAYELGIDRVKCRVCCAWDMLFKQAPKFEEEMNKLMRGLGHPVRPVVAVQARVKSDDVQKSVTAAEHYLNCAQRASKELKFKTPVYIPVLNNRLVVHILQKKYFRIMKTPIEIETATRTVHTHLGNLPADTEQEVVLGVQERTFKEFFLMLNSTLLVRAKGHLGSFGNVADAIRRHYGKPGTVHTYTSGGSSCAVFPDGAKIE